MRMDVLEMLRATTSMNEKLQILQDNKNDAVLKKVLFYTYSPLVRFYVGEYENVSDFGTNNVESAFQLLNDLSARKLTGVAARESLTEISKTLTKDAKKILRGIIGKDLSLGISEKSVNKIWPKLIDKPGYMRCSDINSIKNIKYSAIAQRKADGVFCNVVLSSQTFLTRGGHEFQSESLAASLKILSTKFDAPVVLHGELLVVDKEGKELPRKVGNGMINSFSKKVQSLDTLEKSIVDAKTPAAKARAEQKLKEKIQTFEEIDKNLKLVVWDYVPYENWIEGEWKVPYHCRFSALISAVDGADRIEIIEWQDVESESEAFDFYNKQRELGYEGAVLKNKDFSWKNHTSPHQVKMKAEKECELLVVGYVPGTNQFEGGIGSLSCVSSDKKLAVDVSGLTRDERGFIRSDVDDFSKGIQLREGFDLNHYTGKIITVKFNEVIQSEGRDTYSLFLPVFIEIREDKSEADSLEKILAL